MNESLPELLTIETDAISLQRRHARSSTFGLGAFGFFLLPLVIMMVGGGVFGMTRPDWWSPFLSVSWLMAILSTTAAGIARVNESPRRGTLTIADGQVTVRSGKAGAVLPSGSVVGGSVTPGSDGGLLILNLDDGRLITAKVPSAAAASRALEALHIDPLGRPLVGRFRGGMLRTFAGFGAGFALFLLGGWLKATLELSFTSGMAWLLLCVLLVSGWLLSTRPPEIAVGADGVRIRGKWGARFIAHSAIASATVDDLGALVITRHDGVATSVRIAMGNGPMLTAVLHRIELAREAARASEDSADRHATLSRGGRSLAEWRVDLEDKARRADYRHARLTESELGAIVGSSGASAEQRIGAAIALRQVAGDDGRGRIRLAAEQCVDARVRVALQRIGAVEPRRGEVEAEVQAMEEALADDANGPRPRTYRAP